MSSLKASQEFQGLGIELFDLARRVSCHASWVAGFFRVPGGLPGFGKLDTLNPSQGSCEKKSNVNWVAGLPDGFGPFTQY